MDLEPLFDLLTDYRSRSGVFNQYRDVHPDLDLPQGAVVRRANLRCYLELFAGARIVLVGEAAGYAGCRFSGIPFTCEAQLVADEPLGWAVAQPLGRSSATAEPWAERSATAVWEALGGRRDCLLWNAFPWHPYGDAGPLSNRHPHQELHEGLDVLRCLLSLFPSAKPHAVGRVAQRALEMIGIRAPYIRHPSHGGARRFAEGVDALRQTPPLIGRRIP
jgi:hypothetical protein